MNKDLIDYDYDMRAADHLEPPQETFKCSVCMKTHEVKNRVILTAKMQRGSSTLEICHNCYYAFKKITSGLLFL